MPTPPHEPHPILTSVPARRALPACAAVVGLQWGDEGKGKVVDLLAPHHGAVVRYNGGANAGHSVVIGGKRHALHLVPSGIFHAGVGAVIANGVVVDPLTLLHELEVLHGNGIDVSSLVLSDRAHVVMPYHKAEDALREAVLSGGGDRADTSIGTTKRGIGPAYSEKVQRSAAVRVGDLLRPEVLRERVELACQFKRAWFEAVGFDCATLDAGAIVDTYARAGEAMRPYVRDTFEHLSGLLSRGESLLFEGANATLLDVDHGTYPYVTSSSTTTLGIAAGAGVPARCVTSVVGIMKAYSTRVGGGPFPTELADATGERIRERGREYGTTTGRPRRCGWLDLVALRYATRLNDVSVIALMLLDVLAGFDELCVCTRYRIGGEETDRYLPDAAALGGVEPVYETLPGFEGEITGALRAGDLPKNAARYIAFIEEHLERPVGLVSVGPDRNQTIVRL